MTTSVVLWQTRDAGGTRYLDATLTAEGELVIAGQDLGPGVEQVFGEGLIEYEYALTVAAADVPALAAALGATGGDVLAALQATFGRGQVIGPAALLDEHDIPYEFWSRVGD